MPASLSRPKGERMKWGMRRNARAVLMAVAVAWACDAHADESLERLAALIERGRYGDAWALAEELEAERAGTPRFDLLYGLAAYQAGHYDLAVLAFERLAWQRPNDPRVRLELARARFAVDDDRAVSEIEAVLATDPSPDMLARAEHYLKAMSESSFTIRPRYTAYVAGFLGYDSNINAATAEGTMSLPGQPDPVPLPDEARERSSAFAELDAGAGVESPAYRHRGWFVRGRYRNRSNVDTGSFDLDIVDLTAGASFRHGRSRYRIPVQLQTLLLADSRYRDTISVTGAWSRSLTSRQAVQTLIQAAQVRYRNLRDRDHIAGGGRWTFRPGGRQHRYGVTVIAARETARRDEGEHFGRDLGTLRLSGRWRPWPDHTAQVSVTGQYVRYHADHRDFGERRRDRYLRLVAGWRWILTERWRIEAEASHADNDSRIDVYDYDRTQVQAGIRYDFR
jgi:tetratricopeptide (TPR) repeat protein